MAYYPDSSIYTYFTGAPGEPECVNTGWLDGHHAFPIAPPSEAELDRLWAFCKFNVKQTRGLHWCDFCLPEAAPRERADGSWTRPPEAWDRVQSAAWQVEHKGERLSLGSAEIRLATKAGLIYASPTLIFHYVSAHHYRPPEGFMDALLSGPAPGSEEHLAVLRKVDPDARLAAD